MKKIHTAWSSVSWYSSVNKTKSTCIFTCSQIESEKKTCFVLSKWIYSKPWSTGRQCYVYSFCLLHLPQCPHKTSLTVQVDFRFTESSVKALTLFRGGRFCSLVSLLSLSKGLSIPSYFMLGSIKYKYLLKARDAENTGFCWAYPLPFISLPKCPNGRISPLKLHSSMVQ